ncbi:MAG: metalloregulator ArsR/SmtB family transcription factor [Thermoguttaceae bacterium]|jgi:DNA-binding transcriptional ArsR family regulator
MLHEAIQNLSDADVCLTAGLEADKNSQLTKWSFIEPSGGAMWDFMAVTKALADENRVRLLLALQKRELCVCQLIELVKLAPSTVSKHMSILRSARLVDARKDGRWMYYRLAGAKSSPIVRGVIEWMRESLADDPQIIGDLKRLEQILKMDVHKLCESQCTPK